MFVKQDDNSYHLEQLFQKKKLIFTDAACINSKTDIIINCKIVVKKIHKPKQNKTNTAVNKWINHFLNLKMISMYYQQQRQYA